MAPELARLDVQQATELVVPSATMLGQTVSIKGNGAETVGGVEGAVDRIATEIIRHLEQGPTLVVWAFDASGSLQAERQRLSKHIETVYTHIKQLDESNLAADSGLMTMVVSLRPGPQGHAPQADGRARPRSSRPSTSVAQDETGIETTFTTVAEIVSHWGKYSDGKGHTYHTMVIVVTDEVGDDESRLEDAIAVGPAAKVPVYVLGSQAIFGRSENYVNYTDPKTKQVFYGLQVRQGPESVMLEQIRLPFWYDGPQYDVARVGLRSLRAQPAGRRHRRDLLHHPVRHPPHGVRPRPDARVQARLGSAASSTKSRSRTRPLRQAVLNAALITQQKLPGMPGLYFPPADVPEFKEVMANNQAVAERTAYTVDEALSRSAASPSSATARPPAAGRPTTT